ncbi:MAG TPA: response regulator transcription factor [Nitrospiraceae bacterium]|nr:response regulator transcription factor [Nitrospiraceae bacterium]
MTMVKFLIVDDHPSFRRGVKDILAEGFKGAAVAECGNAQEMLQEIKARKFDLVVMDISMPGRSGPDVLKELKVLNPGLPVLILSMHPEDQYAIRMFKAGASGYLTKSSAPEELVHAAKKVLAGGQYVSATVGEALALTVRSGSEKLPHQRLSDREYEVLCLIASGKTVSEIAEDVHLSVTTISTYRARILEKMGLKNNAELTRYAIQHGLVL